MPHWGGWDGWAGWGWGLLMMIGMALFWVLIIVGVVLLVRWIWDRSAPPGAGREAALDILQKRYARGEITAEQYREMRRELGSGGAAPA
ncbi:MAG: SHOCT domain-containing protein [Armatimonadetes bacterium]|nr:SHOCT domain-containing protein [Armatimonadota bacterium]